MKFIIKCLCGLFVLIIFAENLTYGQSYNCNDKSMITIELKCVNLVNLALLEIEKFGLDLNDYVVNLSENEENYRLTFLHKSFQPDSGVRGNLSGYPAIEVHLSRKDHEVIRVSHVR